MLRFTAILCAGLYLGMLFVGEDRGQERWGLRDAAEPTPVAVVMAEPEPEPQPVAATVAKAPVTATATSLPEGVAALPLVTNASFSPEPEAQVFTLAPVQVEGGAELIVPAEDVSAAAAMSAPPFGETEQARATAGDVRIVTGAAVNVRMGPSTNDPVLGKLMRGDEVLVVSVSADGWAKIRIEGDGIEGYVASRFLSQAGTN